MATLMGTMMSNHYFQTTPINFDKEVKWSWLETLTSNHKQMTSTWLAAVATSSNCTPSKISQKLPVEQSTTDSPHLQWWIWKRQHPLCQFGTSFAQPELTRPAERWRIALRHVARLLLHHHQVPQVLHLLAQPIDILDLLGHQRGQRGHQR